MSVLRRSWTLQTAQKVKRYMSLAMEVLEIQRNSEIWDAYFRSEGGNHVFEEGNACSVVEEENRCPKMFEDTCTNSR